jgi:type I restriction enzyme S subunit
MMSWTTVPLRALITPISKKNSPGLPLLSVVRDKGVILRNYDKIVNHNVIPEDLSGYKVVHSGQFVINKMKAWQGSCGVSQYNGIVSPAYFVFDLHGVCSRFFNYAIRSRKFIDEFGHISTGIRVDQWDLSLDKLKYILFSFPATEEQDQIVRFLDWKVLQINRLINAKKKQVALLKEQRRVLINTVVTRGGDGWQTLRIKDVAEIIGGTTPKSGIADYWDGDINWVTPTDINKKHIFESERKITEKAVKDCSLRVIPKGAVLFTSRAPIGKVALAETDMYCNQGFKNLLCNNNIKSHFLFYWLLANEEYLNALGSGSTFKEISKATFSNVIIQVPGIDSQQQIITQLDEDCLKIDRIADKISIEIILLNEYRTCLISDVVTGKMDVRNIIVPEYEKIKDVSLDDDEEIDNEAINEVAE